MWVLHSPLWPPPLWSTVTDSRRIGTDRGSNFHCLEELVASSCLKMFSLILVLMGIPHSVRVARFWSQPNTFLLIAPSIMLLSSMLSHLFSLIENPAFLFHSWFCVGLPTLPNTTFMVYSVPQGPSVHNAGPPLLFGGYDYKKAEKQ